MGGGNCIVDIQGGPTCLGVFADKWGKREIQFFAEKLFLSGDGKLSKIHKSPPAFSPSQSFVLPGVDEELRPQPPPVKREVFPRHCRQQPTRCGALLWELYLSLNV